MRNIIFRFSLQDKTCLQQQRGKKCKRVHELKEHLSFQERKSCSQDLSLNPTGNCSIKSIRGPEKKILSKDNMSLLKWTSIHYLQAIKERSPLGASQCHLKMPPKSHFLLSLSGSFQTDANCWCGPTHATSSVPNCDFIHFICWSVS